MSPFFRYLCGSCGKGLEYLQKPEERALTVNCPLCYTKNSLEPLVPTPNMHIWMEDGSSEATGTLQDDDFIFIEEDVDE